MSGRGKGRPFEKGASPNPGGRPADAPWREQNRNAAGALLAEIVSRAGKLSLKELDEQLGLAAIRGGLYTEEQIIDMFAKHARTLSDTLAGPHLTPEQRDAIIDDFLARQRKRLAAIEPPPVPEADPEPPPEV